MATKLNTLLESPGISINERDLSQVTVNAVGTNVFVPGFMPQGPTDEPTPISTISEFEEIFGLPTTPAERYSHNAIKQLLTTSNANVTFTRMPYGSGGGYGYAETYNALVFPIVGLSATEITPCSFFQSLPLSTIQSDYPWLVDQYINTDQCYGSLNINCTLASQEETPDFFYIHNTPAQYNTVLKSIKFVADTNAVTTGVRIFQLRPTVSNGVTTFSAIRTFELSADPLSGQISKTAATNSGESVFTVALTSAGTPGLTSIPITQGILSGTTLAGVYVPTNDVFATYSTDAVLKFFYASPDVANSYNTGLISYPGTVYGQVTSVSISSNALNFSTVSSYFDTYCATNSAITVQCQAVSTLTNSAVGVSAYTFSLSASYTQTISAPNSALDNSNLDFLIQFCGTPVDAGLTCDAITTMGLEVPEQYRYNFSTPFGDAQLNDCNFYALGDPISKSLNATEYQLLQNSQFNWKCGFAINGNPALDVLNNDVRAGIVVINKIKTAQLEDFSGYYLALNDNLNVNPATNFDDITGVAGYYDAICPGVSGSWVDVPNERLNFKVSSTFDEDVQSITELVHQNVGVEFGNATYNDSLIMSLFKVRPARLTDTINKLDQVRLEQFVGSLNATRMVADDFGGPQRSFFLEKTVNNGSSYLEVYVNPYLSENNCWNNEQTGLPRKTVRMFREKTAEMFTNYNPQLALKGFADKLYGTGSYTPECSDAAYNLCLKKDIGNLPSKLERTLRQVENPIDFPIDITIDNGLSTIWATKAAVATDSCITDPSICYNYDDTYYVNTDSLSPYDGTVMNSALQDNWETIYNIFDSFARYTRKAAGGVPNIHIQDPLRQIFVNGKDFKVVSRQKGLYIDPKTNQPTEQYATFGRNIYSYLRNLYQGINSSYSISYANWIKSFDSNSDSFTWFGPSAYEAALYARNEAAQYPWTSPLGVSNGLLANINDLGINPNQRERDLISRIGLNPIVRFPEGNLNWNSTTLLKESSALKEISVRRGALWLAKSIQANLLQFIGQPNTVTTRGRISNTLRPILEFMKDNNGVYDYLLVCDERNNTPATIDAGILNVAVYIKPTRPVKFILVDLVITGTGVDFNELI
jgi:hypothetical protein